MEVGYIRDVHAHRHCGIWECPFDILLPVTGLDMVYGSDVKGGTREQMHSHSRSTIVQIPLFSLALMSRHHAEPTHY